MASVTINSTDTIQFVNVSVKDNNDPTLLVQSGDWDVDGHVEAGVAFETFGVCAPLLTSANARKLAHWLIKAADLLDGVKTSKKRTSRHREEDDDADFL